MLPIAKRTSLRAAVRDTAKTLYYWIAPTAHLHCRLHWKARRASSGGQRCAFLAAQLRARTSHGRCIKATTALCKAQGKGHSTIHSLRVHRARCTQLRKLHKMYTRSQGMV